MDKNILLILLLVSVLVFSGCSQQTNKNEDDTIKVGILHSLSGTMAISESSLVDASLMAIDEINTKGGVLGKKIDPIIVDGASDWPTFAREAENLITKDKVAVIFGAWTSASRKTVKPVFEKHNHLLFYPVQYEGLEKSPNIIYTGAAPNQQVLPAVDWAFENVGKKMFLVGSDYVFPRSANEIMKERIEEIGAELVGEEYAILGSTEFREIVENIKAAQPDIILNTINGDSNVAFFLELKKAGISGQDIPTMSFSIAEDELRSMDPKELSGSYTTWNYFQSIDTPTNKQFVRKFQEKYGQDRVTDDPIEAEYFGVYLWAKAVEKAGTIDTDAVREALKGLTFEAPEGLVTVDADNQHVYKSVRIGRVRENGQFDIVFTSSEPIKPVPYPKYRSVDEWQSFLDGLHNQWGQWSNPG